MSYNFKCSYNKESNSAQMARIATVIDISFYQCSFSVHLAYNSKFSYKLVGIS